MTQIDHLEPHAPAETAGSGGDDTLVRKHFVLDTNVLLHNPNALFMFQEHEVVIPLSVIEELDTFKKNRDQMMQVSVQGLEKDLKLVS